MRAHIGGRHVGVSARVPGPTAVMNGLNAVVELVVWTLAAAAFVLAGAAWLLGFLLKVLFWLLAIITAPVWWPIRGWRRHRVKVADRKAVARVQERNLITPTGRAA